MTNPAVAIATFTGSTRAGRRIAQLASQTPKPVVLELGGNAPVVVFDDADVVRVLDTVGAMALINAGQDCMAATRVIVADSRADAFVAGLGRSIQPRPCSATPTTGARRSGR